MTKAQNQSHHTPVRHAVVNATENQKPTSWLDPEGHLDLYMAYDSDHSHLTFNAMSYELLESGLNQVVPCPHTMLLSTRTPSTLAHQYNKHQVPLLPDSAFPLAFV